MVELALLLAALLSLPVSMLLLSRYRRAVLAAMGRTAMGRAVPGAARGPRAAAGRVARAQVLDVPSAGRLRRVLDASRRPALACVPAGAAYAVVLASGMWLGDAQMHGGLRQWLVLAWIYGWPAVVALSLAGAADGRARMVVIAGYCAGYLLVTLPVAASQGVGAAMPLWGSWALINAGGTLLVATVSMRGVRSAGLLVLATVLAAAFAAQGTLALLLGSDVTVHLVIRAAGMLGLSATQIILAVTLLGLGAGALACWPMLRWLARRHEARMFSDQSLLTDAVFITFAVTHSIGPAATDARRYLLGLVAFVAYRSTLALAHRWWALPVVVPHSLLLLRVFRLGRRSEALFDRLRRHWLPLGPLRMVAGPDLAAVAAAPHELLDWLAGRLGQHFVDDDASLAQRLQRLQDGADPDGRHRVDSLFCRDRIWRDAVRHLAARCDAVLMDLRSYGKGNDGCAWEIEQLARFVPLDRVLFLVDASTDRALLQATLDTVTASLEPGSANAGFRCGPVRVMTIDAPVDRTALAICEYLLPAATGGPLAGQRRMRPATTNAR